MKITKLIEWDMGHRIPNHISKCKNLHGHRYKLEICLSGKLITKKGSSDEGMLMDFSDIKTIAMSEIHDLCDHGFMFWKKDKESSFFFNKFKYFKNIPVSFIPTAENLAQWIFKKLEKKFNKKYGNNLRLEQVTIWETPTSKAIFTYLDVV